MNISGIFLPIDKLSEKLSNHARISWKCHTTFTKFSVNCDNKVGCVPLTLPPIPSDSAAQIALLPKRLIDLEPIFHITFPLMML